ncbi:MAG: class I SAM-dependent methyltransferase [Zoogloeaceae bacterium]|jgi:2-polyprenyl-3-methyl-5-hydroxy-6-metoxy-1,4-benzoquinol methylase|nr:class I SAM-dependent methyltransferase [Zoogloeaceae bacterium]
MTQDESQHKYEYVVNPAGDTTAARVVRMVGTQKEVLEIGSGPGSITRVLHDLNHCRITALEIDPEAIKKVAPFCTRVLSADLNDPCWPDLLEGKRFERVVAADVLEHLYDPLTVLRAMKSLVDDRGALVISLPHVGHAAVLACLLDGDFEYRDWGLLDRTHIRFFGIKNMQTLFEQAELKIVGAECVVRHPEATEFVKHWHNLSTSMRRVALSSPFGTVYQVVIKAVPVDAEGDALSLMDMSIPPVSFLEARLRRWARRFLNARSRQWIWDCVQGKGFK